MKLPSLAGLRAAPLSFAEFVMMMAATMALYALAIDTMLPALPVMSRDFTVDDANQLQWFITLFVAGGGCGQLIYGPLSDWLGRRPMLLIGIFFYCALSLYSAFAASLPSLLHLRIAQGAAAASCSVVPRSIIRDRHAGAQMAKVMSITLIVFLIVPVLAPTLGQVLLMLMPWRGIFILLAFAGAFVAAWVALRLPETLHPEHRRTPSATHLLRAFLMILREPSSIYYLLASTAIYAALMAYISTLPQIFAQSFQRPALMPIVFGLCAGTMALASFINARIVEGMGMRKVSHSALLAFTAIAAMHTGFALSGQDGIIAFSVFQALTLGAFGLAGANFGAIAMQKMGAIAGSAASVQGVMMMIGGSMFGSAIGHQWRGDIVLLPAGTALCGLVALICVLIAEGGKLWRAS